MSQVLHLLMKIVRYKRRAVVVPLGAWGGDLFLEAPLGSKRLPGQCGLWILFELCVCHGFTQPPYSTCCTQNFPPLYVLLIGVVLKKGSREVESPWFYCREDFPRPWQTLVGALYCQGTGPWQYKDGCRGCELPQSWPIFRVLEKSTSIITCTCRPCRSLWWSAELGVRLAAWFITCILHHFMAAFILTFKDIKL